MLNDARTPRGSESERLQARVNWRDVVRNLPIAAIGVAAVLSDRAVVSHLAEIYPHLLLAWVVLFFVILVLAGAATAALLAWTSRRWGWPG